jgi:hypothetical protein
MDKIVDHLYITNWETSNNISELKRNNIKAILTIETSQKPITVLDYYKKNKPNEFIPVYSAFNGFAIYKTVNFIDCSYSSMIDLSLFNKELVDNQVNLTGCKLINFFERDCEHRHFHFESIKKNKSKIMIYPKCVFRK